MEVRVSALTYELMSRLRELLRRRGPSTTSQLLRELSEMGVAREDRTWRYRVWKALNYLERKGEVASRREGRDRVWLLRE